MPQAHFSLSLMSRSLIATSLFSTLACQANTFSFPAPTTSDFGSIGLIQMPSARNAPDGQFYLGASINQDYNHYFASLQLMPWLGATIRYTQTPHRRYSSNPNFSHDTDYTDKGIDVSLRLLKESYWLPETSIGIRDLGGTGLFDGEFIAASKRWYDFDFTLGIGWGYLGNRANLFGDKNLANDCDRDSGYKGTGGDFDVGRWFSGCASLFGGIEYQTPWQPLTLKLEYDGNDYQAEFVDGLTQSSPWNIGAVYRFDDWADIRVNFERGNTLTLGVTLKTNFNQLKQSWIDEAKPKPKAKPRAKSKPRSKPIPKHQNKSDINSVESTEIDWKEVSQDLASIAGYQNAKIYADNDHISVIASQRKYRNRQIAHDRAAQILSNIGTQATRFSLIETEKKQLINQVDIDAKQYEAYAYQSGLHHHISDAITVTTPTPPEAALQIDQTRSWNASLAPVLQQSFGGPEGFYLFNIGVSGQAHYWLTNHIELSGSLYFNLYDNYDKYLHTVPQDASELKRVRTLIRQYIQDKPIRLNNLQLTAFDQYFNHIFVQGYAGYLETMFAGIGGEILYRETNSNWALGLNANYVKQRDPNSQFDLFKQSMHFDPKTGHYYSVQTGTLTGHASIYYQPKWQWIDDLQFKVSAGKYLAEDVGVTLDISKQFNTGVKAGAYITKTNLSAQAYGEGSFTKGFYISIPFDLLTVKPSTARTLIQWTPLTRDGGQMLNRKYSLYELTNARYSASEFF